MVGASGISLYVLFSSSPKDSPRIVQQLIVKQSNEGNGTIYKIANEVAKDLKQELPPLSSINSKGLALSMYIRNTSCDKLRTKALSHSPLKSITSQEWLVANSQIYDPNLEAKSTETSIPAYKSKVPEIICIDDMAIPQGFVEQKDLPKSMTFTLIIVSALLCALLYVISKASWGGQNEN